MERENEIERERGSEWDETRGRRRVCVRFEKPTVADAKGDMDGGMDHVAQNQAKRPSPPCLQTRGNTYARTRLQARRAFYPTRRA